MADTEQTWEHWDRFYRSNRQLGPYYSALPGRVRHQLCQAAGPITTLGELQAAAEHLKASNRKNEAEPQ